MMMTNPMRRWSALSASASLCALLAACGTEEIGPDNALYSQMTQTSADQGALLVVAGPTPSTAEAVATGGGAYAIVRYMIFIDGKRLVMQYGGGGPVAIRVAEGGLTKAGFLDAGPHRFSVTAEEGDSTILFADDIVMPAGAVTRVYLFGPSDALAGLSLSYPLVPPVGTRHVSVTNLALDGPHIEVMSCEDATRCVPLSPPLATGDTFDANVPRTGFEDDAYSLDASGAGIGLRQVPTNALPRPPVVTMSGDACCSGGPAVNIAAATMLMGADGSPVMWSQ
jgi:hypothetical protein